MFCFLTLKLPTVPPFVSSSFSKLTNHLTSDDPIFQARRLVLLVQVENAFGHFNERVARHKIDQVLGKNRQNLLTKFQNFDRN
jgi:hypothetical protein